MTIWAVLDTDLKSNTVKNTILVGLLWVTIFAQASAAIPAESLPDHAGSAFECRAIAVTGFGDGDDIFTEDSKRAILTVPTFSITSATANNARVALHGGIAPRDITMRAAFSSAEAMLNELRLKGHVLPQPLSPNPDYASNPDAPCNSDAVKTAITNPMDDWITSAFPRVAGTPAPGKAHSVIVYAWSVPATPTAAELEQKRKAKEAASQAAQRQAAERAALQRDAVAWLRQRNRAICVQKLSNMSRGPGEDSLDSQVTHFCDNPRQKEIDPALATFEYCKFMRSTGQPVNRSTGQPESVIHAACDATP